MSVFDYLVTLTKGGLKKFIGLITLANRSYSHEDYHTDTMKATYQPYRVGENNVDSQGGQQKTFVSKSTLIYTTTDAYVKFNRSDNIVNAILANNFFMFEHDITTIHYAYQQEEGTIYIWCEGVLANEGRIGD